MCISADYFPALIVETWSKLDPEDAKYFRTERERMYGCELEDLAKGAEVKLPQMCLNKGHRRLTFQSRKSR